MDIIQLITTSTSSGDNIDVSNEINNTINGITNLAQAIKAYGPLIVLMSIFFVIFILLVFMVIWTNKKMMNRMMKREDNSDKTDQAILNKFIENVLEAQSTKDKDDIKTIADEIKESLKPIETALNNINNGNNQLLDHHGIGDGSDDYHKDLVGAYIDVNMAFKDASREALNALKCDRIGLYVFHNGNSSLHGLPFFKMSCIHEWTTRGGNTLRGKSHVDMPLHLFNDFIENLWKDGYYKSENVDKSIEIDPSMKEFIAFSDTKSLYMVSIKNNEGSLVGFVSAEFDKYDTFEHDKDRNDQIKAILDKMITKVSPIVSTKYVYKKK